MRQILSFVNINGKITHHESAPIPTLNEEFLYGYGIFTTIKVREGYPLFLDHHLHRLETSAAQLNIRLPSYVLHLTSDIQKAAWDTIKKNNLAEGGIRITITPAAICIHTFTTADTKIRKVAVITTPDTRDIYKTHKVTCRIPHLLAQKKAQSKRAQDALFTQNKEIVESTNANIFTYTSSNIIITPPIKDQGLNGITRQILMENLPVQEAPIPISTTNPLILVNSLSLRLVESIDGRKLNQNPEFVNLIRQTLDEAEKNYIASSKLVRLGRKN